MADWLKKFTGALKFGKPLQEALPEMITPNDPRTAIYVLGNDWLCPYTGVRIEAPDWDGTAQNVLKSQSIVSHLLKQPELQKQGSKAEMRPFNDLIQTMLYARFEGADNYKVTDKQGEWVCPYCLMGTGVILTNWDGSAANVEWFIPEAMKHFKNCEEYQKDPVHNHRTREDILYNGGDRAKLTKYLNTDPRFKICDAAGSWVCPFSARPIPALNCKKEAWGPALHTKIIDYMLGPECPGKYSQFEVEKSVEEIKKIINTKSVRM